MSLCSQFFTSSLGEQYFYSFLDADDTSMASLDHATTSSTASDKENVSLPGASA